MTNRRSFRALATTGRVARVGGMAHPQPATETIIRPEGWPGLEITGCWLDEESTLRRHVLAPVGSGAMH